MDDLADKIERFYKSLLSLKQKQDFFVPTIKPPTLKTPSPSGKVGKLPGIPPPSKKNPVKVAEQLKNPRPKGVQVEVLKVETNGQWSLEKADDKTIGKISPLRAEKRAIAQAPVSATTHGWGPAHHSSDQNNLIEGLNLQNTKPMGRGISGAVKATSPNHSHNVIVKNAHEHPNRQERGHTENNFNSAKREVLFHNLANNFFGMGKHVPTTAGFSKNDSDYSAQQMIPNAGHADRKHEMTALDSKTDGPENPFEARTHEPGHDEFANSNHGKILDKLHGSGDLHKLAMMDNIMGHHDRHGGNYMLDNKGDNLHLIDNGTAFDYKNFDTKSVPAYLADAQDKDVKGMGKDSKNIHPDAAKWVNSLNPEKVKEILAAHGHDENSSTTQGLLRRLAGMKNSVANGSEHYKDTDSLLHNNRLTSGPLYKHRGPFDNYESKLDDSNDGEE